VPGGSPFFLTGVQVPQERLEAIAALSSLPLRSIASDQIATLQASAASILCLIGAAVNLARPDLWVRGMSAWIELGDLSNTTLAALLRRAYGTSFYVSVTTSTAHEVPLSSAITKIVADTLGRDADALTDVELALQEAISNGLIHGNLQVNGIDCLNVNALDSFSTILADRLEDPEYGDRRLEIICRLANEALTIEVADEGEGYHHKPKPSHAPSGRGLALIGSVAQAYEILEGGRRIRMRFIL